MTVEKDELYRMIDLLNENDLKSVYDFTLFLFERAEKDARIKEAEQEKEFQKKRHYFRLQCSFDTHFWLLGKIITKGKTGCFMEGDTPDAKNIEKAKKYYLDPNNPFPVECVNELGAPLKAMIVDISGGGLQLITDARLEENTILGLLLFLKGDNFVKEMAVRGEVVRIHPSLPTLKRIKKHSYGIKFIGITEKTREEIIQFIFSQLRNKMR